MQVVLWWFLYWKYIIIFISLLALLIGYNYLKLFSIGDAIFWKLKYLIIFWIVLFIIFYEKSGDLLSFLVTELQQKQIFPEKVQLRDPQEYIYLCFEIAWFYSFLCILPLIIFYSGFYSLSFWDKNQQYIVYSLLLNIYYYYFLTKWVVDNDLYLSGWEVTLEENSEVYAFQPDLALLNWIYLGEFWDLIIFFILLLGIYNVSVNNYYFYWTNSNYIINLQVILNMLIISYGYYLFGGESVIRDLILISFILMLQEINYLILYFFSFLKLKK